MQRYPSEIMLWLTKTIVGFAALLPAVNSALAGGGFSATCSNARFLPGGTLSASCQTNFWHNPVESTIYINAVLGNFNGVLGWDGKYFAQSCSQCQMINGHDLRCCCATNFLVQGPDACDNGHGGWTIKNLDERIANFDGGLVYVK